MASEQYIVRGVPQREVRHIIKIGELRVRKQRSNIFAQPHNKYFFSRHFHPVSPT